MTIVFQNYFKINSSTHIHNLRQSNLIHVEQSNLLYIDKHTQVSRSLSANNVYKVEAGKSLIDVEINK